jgi:invasion protein IalB
MKKTTFALRLLLSSICVLPASAVLAQEQKGIEMQGPTSLSETYDAWTVQCANQQQGAKVQRICQMSQNLVQQKTQQRVLTFALGVGDKGTKATLVLPFGLLLSEGFRVQIGEEEILKGAYRTCLPAGCIAEVDLPAETIKKLETGKAASVLMTATSGQQVKTDVSPKGFKAAYDRLVALAAEPSK